MNEPVGFEDFKVPPTILCFEDPILGFKWFFDCRVSGEGCMVGVCPGEMPGHWIRYRLDLQLLRACVHPAKVANLN